MWQRLRAADISRRPASPFYRCGERMRPTTSPLQQATRLEWVDGSALTWRDLRTAVAAEEAMLAVHMRGLHGTYGVALGLTTLLATNQRSVLVTPGFAITCLGAPLLLSTAQAMDVPPAPGAWDLLIVAPPLGAGDPCYRPTSCDLAIPPRLASLRWHRADSTPDQRTSVVIARYIRLASGLLEGPNLEGRRGVRVMERPRIASGVVSGSALTWTTRDDRLVASIDTASAGFSKAAIYRVWVASHDPWPSDVIGALPSVLSVLRAGFDIQLLVPGTASNATARRVATGLSLGWLGIEPVRGCPPAFSRAQIVSTVDLSLWS